MARKTAKTKKIRPRSKPQLTLTKHNASIALLLTKIIDDFHTQSVHNNTVLVGIGEGLIAHSSALGVLTEAMGALLPRMEAVTATNRILADHARRLLKEKEQLVSMIGRQEIERQLRAANNFMSEETSDGR
jgi:hypothetical protein